MVGTGRFELPTPRTLLFARLRYATPRYFGVLAVGS